MLRTTAALRDWRAWRAWRGSRLEGRHLAAASRLVLHCCARELKCRRGGAADVEGARHGGQRAAGATWQLEDSSGSCQGIRAVLQQLLLLGAAAAWHVQLSVGRAAALLQLGDFRSGHRAGAAVLLVRRKLISRFGS